MTVERLIERVYELDSAIHPSDEVKKHTLRYALKADSNRAKRTIKGLNQEQRKLVVDVLKKPSEPLPNEKINELLTKLRSPATKNHSIRSKISKAWKNRFSGRIKSSVVLEIMATSRNTHLNSLQKKLEKILAASEIKTNLDFFINNPLDIQILNDFLNTNAKQLSIYSLKNPKKWLNFSTKMQDLLGAEKYQTYLAKCLIRLFIRLDRCVQPRKNNPIVPRALPKELYSQIVSKLPSNQSLESFIATMKILYGSNIGNDFILGSIPIKIFADWVQQRKIPLHELNLPLEDLKKMTGHYHEMDTSPWGIKGKWSIENTKHLGFSFGASIEELQHISIFPNINSLSFQNGFYIGPEKILKKEFKKLETITFRNSTISLNQIANLSCIKTLRNLSLELESISEEALSQIAAMKHLKSLSIQMRKAATLSFEKFTRIAILKLINIIPEKIHKLPVLKKLTLEATTLPKSILNKIALIKNLESLTLATLDCSKWSFQDLNHLKALSIHGKIKPNALENLRELKHLKLLNYEEDYPNGFDFPPQIETVTLRARRLNKKMMSSLSQLKNLKKIYVHYQTRFSSNKKLESLIEYKPLF